MNPAPERNYYLLFRSRSWVGALALRDVREIMRPLPVERLSSAPEFVLGVAVIRGTPTPVIDTGMLLNAVSGRSVTAQPNRFISLKVGSRGVCLAVDAVLDVRTLTYDELRLTPPLLGDSNTSIMPRIGALDAELLAVLNAARVVPDEVWASIQSPAPPG